MMTDLLTSAEVARIAGVGPTAVKRWADAGTLPCIRTAGGHRRFRRYDVDRFVARSAPGGGAEWNEWIDVLLHDIDGYAVQSLLFGERSSRGSWHAVADALGGLLDALGRRWEDGSLSVIDEHIASASLQRGLTTLVGYLPLDPRSPRCLLASVEKDEHTLGLSLVELCLREAGWRSEWAGARTPADEIAHRVARGDLAMVGVSASAWVADDGLLQATVDAVGAACRTAGAELVIGGSGAWPDIPGSAHRFSGLESFYHFAVDARTRAVG